MKAKVWIAVGAVAWIASLPFDQTFAFDSVWDGIYWAGTLVWAVGFLLLGRERANRTARR